MGNFRIILNEAINHIRICIGCGAILFEFGPNMMVCNFCRKDFKKSEDITYQSTYPFPQISLYQWNYWNQNLMARSIHQLKGCHWHQKFTWFVQAFEEKLINQSSIWNDPDLIIVPSPPRILGGQDHASGLAQALGNRLRAPVEEVLRRLSLEEQKHKQKSDRWKSLKNRMGITSELSSFELSTKPIAFVDDLITSGGTAASAHIALGRPKKFEVWTLFQRPLLRGKPGFDITQQS